MRSAAQRIHGCRLSRALWPCSEMSDTTMPIEPTPLERQRLAFAYLREHAAHAHVAGDGLLANLLCHTGLDRAGRLADARRLLLTKADLAWMPIFALFWLDSPHERSIVANIVKKLPQPDPADDAIGEWLGRHT